MRPARKRITCKAISHKELYEETGDHDKTAKFLIKYKLLWYTKHIEKSPNFFEAANAHIIRKTIKTRKP